MKLTSKRLLGVHVVICEDSYCSPLLCLYIKALANARKGSVLISIILVCLLLLVLEDSGPTPYIHLCF